MTLCGIVCFSFSANEATTVKEGEREGNVYVHNIKVLVLRKKSHTLCQNVEKLQVRPPPLYIANSGGVSENVIETHL